MILNPFGELSFRRPMAVTEILYFPRCRDSFPRCPRCQLTLDREYMQFCDRCGQRLDWSTFNLATIVWVK